MKNINDVINMYIVASIIIISLFAIILFLDKFIFKKSVPKIVYIILGELEVLSLFTSIILNKFSFELFKFDIFYIIFIIFSLFILIIFIFDKILLKSNIFKEKSNNKLKILYNLGLIFLSICIYLLLNIVPFGYITYPIYFLLEEHIKLPIEYTSILIQSINICLLVILMFNIVKFIKYISQKEDYKMKIKNRIKKIYGIYYLTVILFIFIKLLEIVYQILYIQNF